MQGAAPRRSGLRSTHRRQRGAEGRLHVAKGWGGGEQVVVPPSVISHARHVPCSSHITAALGVSAVRCMYAGLGGGAAHAHAGAHNTQSDQQMHHSHAFPPTAVGSKHKMSAPPPPSRTHTALSPWGTTAPLPNAPIVPMIMMTTSFLSAKLHTHTEAHANAGKKCGCSVGWVGEAAPPAVVFTVRSCHPQPPLPLPSPSCP